jgi:hypothetical protein
MALETLLENLQANTGLAALQAARPESKKPAASGRGQ